jgi:hypothetical protein
MGIKSPILGKQHLLALPCCCFCLLVSTNPARLIQAERLSNIAIANGKCSALPPLRLLFEFVLSHFVLLIG